MIDARQKLRSILRKKKQTNNKQLGRLNIQQMPVADLIAADYNPRMIDEATLDGLQSSIERFGLVEPIVWNKRTNMIVGGHQRLKVLQRRGDEATDVVVVDLDEVDERTLNLTLNNPHLQGIFDQERLEVLIKDLQVSLPELDFGELRLDELNSMQGMPNSSNGKDIPDFQPVDVEEQSRLDEKKKATCPECGHEFTP